MAVSEIFTCFAGNTNKWQLSSQAVMGPNDLLKTLHVPMTILHAQIWKSCSDYATEPKKAMTAFWGAQLRFFRQLVCVSPCSSGVVIVK